MDRKIFLKSVVAKSEAAVAASAVATVKQKSFIKRLLEDLSV